MMCCSFSEAQREEGRVEEVLFQKIKIMCKTKTYTFYGLDSVLNKYLLSWPLCLFEGIQAKKQDIFVPFVKVAKSQTFAETQTHLTPNPLPCIILLVSCCFIV